MNANRIVSFHRNWSIIAGLIPVVGTALFCAVASTAHAQQTPPVPTTPVTPAVPPKAGDGNAAGGTPPAAPGGTTPAPPAPEVTTPAGDIFKFGVDYYIGVSNIYGPTKRITDGAWAGSSTFYPSNAHADWTHGDTQSAHVSLGLGDLSVGKDHPFDQPLEAYYTDTIKQKSGGTLAITGGKFFTPFGIQEWEYEPRYGAEVTETPNSQLTYSLAVQYNKTVKDGNGYFRVGYSPTPKTTVGASLAAGKGWTYSSAHDNGFGADLTQDLGVASLVAEFTHAGGGGESSFNFGDARATLTKLGKFRPFLGVYDWKDQSGQLGDFRSVNLGLGYQQSPHLYFEPAYARTATRNVFWLEAKVSL